MFAIVIGMTLTELSVYVRRFLPLVVILLFVVLIFYYAFRLLIIYVSVRKTPQSLYINTIFDKLPPIKLESTTAVQPKKFTLDTIEGRPVTATATANIYFLPPAISKLGYRQRLVTMANTLGFDTDLTGYSLNDTQTQAKYQEASQEATIDIANFNFSYQYYINQNPRLFAFASIPSKNAAENTAVEFLRSLNKYPEELAQGRTNIIYIRYSPQNNELKVVDNPDEANMVEVDFYRADIDGVPVVSPTYFNSQNYVVMVFGEDTPKIVKAQIKFFDRSTEQVGVYPLKSGDEAWKELQAGKGFHVAATTEDEQGVNISKMFVGYLDPDISQDYIQPVYVFLGDKGYVGYVPAVQSDFIQN